MDKKQIEAYNYYRRLYPGDIVLYHIGDSYVALGDDAVAVAQSLVGNAKDVTDECKIPSDDVDIISRLGEFFQLRMIDYRNRDGDLDFPDIQELEKERSEDF